VQYEVHPQIMTTVIRSAARHVGLVFLAMACHVCWASGRDVPISQFRHTVWSPKDGAPADVWAIAQTRDGWLWFGGTTGLYRFDGIRFERLPIDTSGTAGTEAVSALFALESGELLIGYQQGGRQGLWRHDGNAFRKAMELPDSARGQVARAVAVSANADVWLAVRDGGLFRHRAGTWQRNGGFTRLPAEGPLALARDASGRLWFGYPDNTVCVLDAGRITVLTAKDGLQIGAVTAIGAVMEEAYLVGREALLNAFRHAAAHEIEVQIIYDADKLRVRVRDDGVGLDERSLEAGSHPGHWGLQGMQERAQRVGARLDIWSRPGAGSEIELAVPAVLAYRELETQSHWRLFWQLRGDGR
jgi:hypothetical protein